MAISRYLYNSFKKDLKKNQRKLNTVRNDPRINYYGGRKQKQERIKYLKHIVTENKKLIKANTPEKRRNKKKKEFHTWTK